MGDHQEQVPLLLRQPADVCTLDTNRTMSISGDTMTSAACKFGLFKEGGIFIIRKSKATRGFIRMMFGGPLMEFHHIYLAADAIKTTGPLYHLKSNIPYTTIDGLEVVTQLILQTQPYRSMGLRNGAYLLLHAAGKTYILLFESNYKRCQWIESLKWQMAMDTSRRVLTDEDTTFADSLIAVKEAIACCKATPILDEDVWVACNSLIAPIVDRDRSPLVGEELTQLLEVIAPAMEHCKTTDSVSLILRKICSMGLQSESLYTTVADVVRRILKFEIHATQQLETRGMVIEFLAAVGTLSNGKDMLHQFLMRAHSVSLCPFPKVMPNVVQCCFRAVYDAVMGIIKQNNVEKCHQRLDIFTEVIRLMACHEDWRGKGKRCLSVLLRTVPFPEEAVTIPAFQRAMLSTMMNMVGDASCEVHQCLVPVTPGKKSWVVCLAPNEESDDDVFHMWDVLIGKLVSCCYTSSRMYGKLLFPFINVLIKGASSGRPGCAKVLGLMLRFDAILTESVHARVTRALCSSDVGLDVYKEVCQHHAAISYLHTPGGPRSISLGSSTKDADLKKLLTSKHLGSLRFLNLAFTSVTEACVEEIIKLPYLKYLNLWGTQVNDTGVQLLSEHLTNLRVLNLCETAVTDECKNALLSMTSLRSLNASSTRMSEIVLLDLQLEMPNLTDVDSRYTQTLWE